MTTYKRGYELKIHFVNKCPLVKTISVDAKCKYHAITLWNEALAMVAHTNRSSMVSLNISNTTRPSGQMKKSCQYVDYDHKIHGLLYDGNQIWSMIYWTISSCLPSFADLDRTVIYIHEGYVVI